ncbi:MAG: DUF805 domain-containing protein [Massilia sp.]|nr:DUF805 domain-containing protein [Massilia sp.]
MNNPYNAPASDLSRAGENVATYQPQILAVNGRIGRLRYLAYTFGLAMACMVAAALLMGVLAAISPKMMMLGMIIYIPALAISFIMAIRRLNDMGHPGWWSLLTIIPILNFFFGLWLIFGPGDAGSNNYGLPPTKNSTGVVVAALALPLFIALVGILAAVAIPAYQSYVLKAKASRGALPAPAQLQAQ